MFRQLPFSFKGEARPASPRHNVTNGALRNSVFNGKLALKCIALSIALAYGLNLIGSQYSGSATRAVSGSPLLGTVAHVVALTTGEKVIGANARGIVAMVEDSTTIRNAPVVDFVRQPMSEYGLTPVVAPGLDTAIPFSVSTSSPKPATIGALNLIPEPLRNADFSAVFPPAQTRTEFTPTLRENTLLDPHFYTATGTLHDDTWLSRIHNTTSC